MATVTLRSGIGNTANGTTYTSESFTPTTGDLVVLFAAAGDTVSAGSATASANGITFTRVASTAYRASSDTLYVFVANQLVGTSPSAMTVTVDVTGDAATGAFVVVSTIAGMTKVGSAAVAQTAFVTNGAFNTTPSASFAVAPKVGNPQLGLVTNGNSPTGVSPPSGWTSAADVAYVTPQRGASASQLAAGGAEQTVTWGSVSQSVNGAIVAEFDAPVTIGTTYPATGTVSATTATSATARLRTTASGTIPATTTAAAATTARRTTAGTVAAVSTVAGAATMAPATSGGTVAAISSATGQARLRAAASGTVEATTTVTGAVTSPIRVAGTVTALSEVAGAAVVYEPPPPIPAGAIQVTLGGRRTEADWNATDPGVSVTLGKRNAAADWKNPGAGVSVTLGKRGTHVTL